jgi:hypothetical protein
MSNLEETKELFLKKMKLKDRQKWRSGYWTLADDYEDTLSKAGKSLGQDFWNEMTKLLGEAKQA